MMKVGITGGIGSGKSTVCRLFARLGVAVYDSDAGAKRLMTEAAELRRRYANHTPRPEDTLRAFLARQEN